MANSFSKMIKAGVIKRTDNGMFIRLDEIHEKPGFNTRVKDDVWEASIQELSAYLEAGGKVPPFEVYARDDGGVWIVEGHRRFEAYRRIAAKGSPVDLIHILQFNGNDAERKARIGSSASQMPLRPLERAAVYAELRAFNWTNEDIARRMGKDAEHVKRHLDLIDAPTAVQQMVKRGEVSATVAVRQTRQHGEKAADVLTEQLEAAKAQGKSKVTDTTMRKAKPKPAFAVPDGFALVPLVPTQEMLDAFQNCNACYSETAYSDMLKIAPQPGGVE